ncbi:MAG: dihydrolipoamide dehydrogenase [Puniceicoccaceae bacterium 5H]|nr:MAG: dihydrolipoamide dehydrogenase [Puniceicoccaceae bacterium 5H]
MSDTSFDVIVIGSGPGGYVCAIRAAQLGLKTAVVERDSALGGTCLNVGCIPSKALLHSSEFYHEVSQSENHGVKVDGLKLDLAQMMKRKDEVVKRMNGGVKMLMDKRKITVFEGTGELQGEGKVKVTPSKGDAQTLEGKNIVIATGSAPVELPFLKFDGKHIVSSTEAIAFDEVPPRMLVIGGGAIGLELGCVWSRLGSEVTVIEFLPTIAAGSDDDISKLAERVFKKQGLKIATKTKVTGAEVKDGVVKLTAEQKDKEVTYEAEKVLLAVGRRAYTEGLGLDKAGVEADERGRVKVDEHLRTSAKGVWAIGDVVAGPMLAHKAEEDGVAVAEWIAGKAGHIDWDLVPGVIYTDPEIANVGLTERAAKEQGIDVKVGKFALAANGRAVAQDATDGVVKIIADAKTDKILGAAIIARGASEMIANIVAHMTYGGSAEDLGRTIHAHPTVSESIKEAALAVDKQAIHSV